jgi:glycosyltransferase involved in cell wall biosynthesis
MSKLESIALVAPIAFPISRSLYYAGTERVVDYLNQGYSELGINSRVFASGDSDLSNYGTLIPTVPNHIWKPVSGIRKNQDDKDAYEQHYGVVIDEVSKVKTDIIHDNPGTFFVLSDAYANRINSIDIPIVTTLHGGLTDKNKERILEFQKIKSKGYPIYFVGLSKAHKELYESYNDFKVDTFIYNGIPVNNFDLVDSSNKQPYLFWIGRVHPDKGPDLAIEVAKQTKLPLVIAGEAHLDQMDFFKEKILSSFVENYALNSNQQQFMVDSAVNSLILGENPFKKQGVYFLGPVNDGQKNVLYGNALGTLMPNRWAEPFGLVAVESMSTGTPVIGTKKGALSELIHNGETGYSVDCLENGRYSDRKVIDGFVEAVNNLSYLNSDKIRQNAQNNYSVDTMAREYISFFEKLR